MTALRSHDSILLVEDNPDDIELTLRAFASQGLANPIVVATDGAEALALLHPHDGSAGTCFSLVLLDLNLPRIGGLDVLLAMRNDPRTLTVPVVVLTTSAEERDVVASYRLGGNSFVRKPIALDEFTTAVRQLGLYWLMINEPPPRGAAQSQPY